jgi:hypothetical protein
VSAVANPKSWHGDWHQRILDGLAKHGHPSMTSYTRAHPTWTYRQLAEALGPDIAPLQVQWIERDEAITENRFVDFASSSLARTLRECLPNGWHWGESEDENFHVAHSTGSWSGALGEGYSPQVHLVANKLTDSAIPKGWLPNGPDDPFIVAALHGVEFKKPES